LGQDLAGGRYQVTAQLSGGGMASVYRARDRHLETEVIIKVPLPELVRDPAFSGLFDREVRSLVRLGHPRIVKVLDVGKHGGTPFAVLQYLAGGSLRDRQLKGGGGIQPLLAATLSDWLAEIAEALDYIHGQGFLHRDVKPSNILFDNVGHAYLGDFGVIKALAAEQGTVFRSPVTEPGRLLGTLPYMSPEILAGSPCDGKSDQFALAVTVYEVLTGRYPFPGNHPGDIFDQHHAGPPRPAHELAPGVPEAIARALQRGLALKPAERFPNCALLARAVLQPVRAAATVTRPDTPRTGRPPVVPGTGLAGPGVQAACPLCQELLEVWPGQAGQNIHCSSCQAELHVAADLSQLMVVPPPSRGLTLSGALATVPNQPTEPKFEYVLSGAPPPAPAGAPPPASSGYTLSVDSAAMAAVGQAAPGGTAAPPGAPALPGPGPAPHLAPAPPVVWGETWREPPPRKSVKAFLLAALLLFLLGFGGFYVWETYFQPETPEEPAAPVKKRLIVDPKGGKEYYATVTEALAAAPENATILVRPGHYRENVVLDKQVRLLGDGPADQIILEGTGSAPAVRVQADSGLLRGLSLRSKTTGDGKQPALEISRGRLEVLECDISSEGQAAVAISGPQARPVLRQCKVHDCPGTAVQIDNKAGGRLENCEVSGNTGPGVKIGEGCSTVLRRCRIHDGWAGGVLLTKTGAARLEDCDIYRNAGSGVEIRSGADPTLRGCKIYDGKLAGVLIKDGFGTFQDCSISNNRQSGVIIRDGSNPTFKQQCKISDNKGFGVSLHSGGKALLDDCEIYGNARAGLRVANAEVAVQNCKIHDGSRGGVWFAAGGKGTLEKSRIYGNARPGVQISAATGVKVEDCKVYDNDDCGIVVAKNGSGTVTLCEVHGNAKAGIYVEGSGTAVVQRSQIHDGKQCGMLVEHQGNGRVDDCKIYDNAEAGVDVRKKGRVYLYKCEIQRNTERGLRSYDEGYARVEECDLTGNTGGSLHVDILKKPYSRIIFVGNKNKY
jgi:F-box protein 11